MGSRVISGLRWILIFLLPVSLVTSAQTLHGDSLSSWIPDDQDLRIFEVRVQQYTFDDVITAYQFEDVVLLPLRSISELLQVAVEVKESEASGFVLREDRGFFLDAARAQVILQGNLQTYHRDSVQVLLDDIYVDSNLLGHWWGMSFDVDLFASRIGVESEIPFPLLRRIERERQIARSLSQLNRDQVTYPYQNEAYEIWSAPFVDQFLRWSQRKTESGESLSNYSYSTYATADLARHEASVYFSGNDGDPTDESRLTLARRNPQGGVISGTNITEYALGHVVEPRLALINQPGAIEAGLTVTNAPLGRQSEYDRHRFIGDLLPGWEVELYRNNVLIGYQVDTANGQYDFQDIPLLLGKNYFRLEFYGPQGQLRTEEVRFDLNQSLTSPGDHFYRATVTGDETDGSRAVLQYDAGLAKRLSVSANLASIPLGDTDEREQHLYLTAGLRTYGDNYFAGFDVIDDQDGGDAFEFALQTRIGDVVFGVTETALNQFFSEEFRPSDIELTHRRQYRIDTAIPPGWLPRIPLGFEYTQEEFAIGGSLERLDALLSLNARGVAISHLLTRQKITGQTPVTNGALQLSAHYSGVRLRGTLNYDLSPDREVTNVFLTADPGYIGDYQISTGLNHSLRNDRTEVSVSANKATGGYNLSLGARYNTDDEMTVDVSLSFGIGREPRNRSWMSRARSMASSGSLSALAFVDTNQNGLFDEGDEPAPDVGFRIGGGFNASRTDDDGISFITGIPVHRPVSVTVAPETIDDPLWTVAVDGVTVVPRPGRPIRLDFPILVSGEVDGTVYLERDGQQYGAGRVVVELLDGQGEIINTTQTAFDGFYVLSNIPFGEYRLRVSEEQLTKLGQQTSTIDGVIINQESLFQSGLNFVLRADEP